MSHRTPAWGLSLGFLSCAALANPCPPDVAICTVPLSGDLPAAFEDSRQEIQVVPTDSEPALEFPEDPAPETVNLSTAAPPPPEPVPIQAPGPPLEPVHARDWQLKDYWILTPAGDPVRPEKLRGTCERGVITVAFTVDAEGRIQDALVTRNRPFNPFREKAVLEQLQGRRYDPVPANRQRQPVRTSESFRFDCGAR